MARSLRIEYPGAHYHVLARGNRRQKIYRDEADRRFFLKALGEACGRTGWRVHAWVLMSNHYHLLLETPEPNLVAGMQWLQNAYTRRFNVRHALWGRVFGDRYKAVPVEGGTGYYYETLIDYLHLNPARARITSSLRKKGLLEDPWSSVAHGYAVPPKQRPGWLAAADGLKAFGFDDTSAGRRAFVARLERIATEDGVRAGIVEAPPETDRRGSALRRGWFWGSQAFKEKLLALVKVGVGKRRGREYRSSQEQKAHDLQRAEELLEEGLRAAGLEEGTLARLPGSDARKTEIARIIWQNTTVGQQWLARKLAMRSAANVSQQLRRAEAARGKTKLELAPGFRRWLEKIDSSNRGK